MAVLVVPPDLRRLDRSTYKLTEVAKRVAMPRDIVGTDWGPVADTCRNEMGIEFDGWQDGMGQLMLSRSTPEPLDDGGILSHTVGGFHLSAMRQIGKCLATDTPILTINRGWTTMAEIKIGDQVVHPSGRSTIVTQVHDVLLGRDCYEVTTTDQRRIIVDDEHLWTVRDKRRLGAPWVTLTTTDMVAGGLTRALAGSRTVTADGKSYDTTEYRFVLPRQEAIAELPEQNLPIDPYLLGAWLGDGISVNASMCSAEIDLEHWVEHISNAGYVPKVRRPIDKAPMIAINGAPGKGLHERSFVGALRRLGVLGDKHVPGDYLIGSTGQRLALLQGLLDTDGHATKSGLVEFTSTKPDLARDVLYLARSLGWRATSSEGKAMLDGVDCGPKYRVTFTAKLEDAYVPFRLQRKVSRIGQLDGRKGRFTVSIKSIDRVASRPVRCIKVTAEDGLFLAGRDLVVTHNTYFFAGGIFGMSQHYPELLTVWSAHHSSTHEETFEAMQGFVARPAVRPFIEWVHTGSGDEEIRFWNGSRILFGARERGFGRGIPGVDVLVSDEGQIMSEKARQNMIATLNTSWLGLHIYAGTPPKPEDKSEGWMRKRNEAWIVKDASIVTTETDDLVWVEFGADDDAKLDDVVQWAKNPSVPHRTPFHAVQRLRRNLDDDGFRREGLGLYDEDEGSVFDIPRWDKLNVENAPQPHRAALVVDISPDRNWSALGIAAELEYDNDDVIVDGLEHDDDEEIEERVLVMVTSIEGTKQTAKLVAELDQKRDLFDIAITPGAARVIETDLVNLGIEYDIMTSAEVAAAFGTMQAKIKSGGVAHVDQAELNFAMINTKSRMLQTGESESFDRREYSVDTSPAVAASCALYRFGLNNSPLPYIG